MHKILIIGATSAIAQEVAKCFAATQGTFYLVARNEAKLEAVVGDLKVRGAKEVFSQLADLSDFSAHRTILNGAKKALGEIDIALIAHGTLGSQKKGEEEWSVAEETIRTNFLSVVSILTPLTNYFEEQGRGCIAVISSVAGDRPRRSNYIYGTSKGAIALFMEGIRNRLSKAGITVLTIKPGFVDTPMTAHLKKNILSANPQTVGRAIYRAILRKKDIVYVPWFWRFIMWIIRVIPEPIFKKLNL